MRFNADYCAVTLEQAFADETVVVVAAVAAVAVVVDEKAFVAVDAAAVEVVAELLARFDFESQSDAAYSAIDDADVDEVDLDDVAVFADDGRDS